MKRFTVPCDFAGKEHPIHLYIGEPSVLRHPIYYQTLWLDTVRGGLVPLDVIDSFNNIYRIARKQGANFEDLCVYSLGKASEKPKTKRDGNVVYVDFKQMSAAAENAPTEKPLSSDLSFKDCRFFGAFPLKGTDTVGFCSSLSSAIGVAIPGFHEGLMAEQLLTAILLLIVAAGGKPQTWKGKLQNYLHTNIENRGAFNLAVAGDAFGYMLAFQDLASIEFFLNSDKPLKKFIAKALRNALKAWALAPVTKKESEQLKRFGARKKDILALKKTLKSIFH